MRCHGISPRDQCRRVVGRPEQIGRGGMAVPPADAGAGAVMFSKSFGAPAAAPYRFSPREAGISAHGRHFHRYSSPMLRLAGLAPAKVSADRRNILAEIAVWRNRKSESSPVCRLKNRVAPRFRECESRSRWRLPQDGNDGGITTASGDRHGRGERHRARDDARAGPRRDRCRRGRQGGGLARRAKGGIR